MLDGVTFDTKIRILSDFVFEGEEGTPVPAGTEVLAHIATEGFLVEPGEAWYVRPDTGEDWISFTNDYEVIA